MLSGSTDFFDGLRTFPRDPNGLRQHIGRLNHTLQKRYFVAPELSELALQGKSSEDFYRYYRQQVARVIAHFNGVTRSQMKVRVDPRHPRGMHLQRGPRSQKNAPPGRYKCAESPAADPSWTAAMIDTSGRLAQRDEAQRALWADAQRTPQGASLAAMLQSAEEKAVEMSEDRSTVLHSSTRKSRKEAEVLFGTPPEFTGFNIPLEASPSDSLFKRSKSENPIRNLRSKGIAMSLLLDDDDDSYNVQPLKTSRLESTSLPKQQVTATASESQIDIRRRGGNGIEKMAAFEFGAAPAGVRLVGNPTSRPSSQGKIETSPVSFEENKSQPATVPKAMSTNDLADSSICSRSSPFQTQITVSASLTQSSIETPVSAASCLQTGTPVVRELFHEDDAKISSNPIEENVEKKPKGQMNLSDFFTKMACPRKK